MLHSATTFAESNSFLFRNGITFGDDINIVKQKEEGQVSEQSDTQLTYDGLVLIYG